MKGKEVSARLRAAWWDGQFSAGLMAGGHNLSSVRGRAEHICADRLACGLIVADRSPRTAHRLERATPSAKAEDCVRRMLKGEAVTQETSGMSKGEWREFEGVIG